jgi:hypothetical protein
MTKKLDSFTASQASTSTVPLLSFKRNQLETEITREFGHRFFSRRSYISPTLSNRQDRAIGQPIVLILMYRSARSRSGRPSLVSQRRSLTPHRSIPRRGAFCGWAPLQKCVGRTRPLSSLTIVPALKFAPLALGQIDPNRRLAHRHPPRNARERELERFQCG